MCSISGAFDKDTLVKLAKENEYRGTHSHSICYFNVSSYTITYLTRGLGPLNYDDIDIPEKHFCIVHQQAPTTDNKDLRAVHPAQLGEYYLWHNGIIKEPEVKRLQKALESTSTWDTKLMLQQLIISKDVDNIDGAFACVYINTENGMVLFRNQIAPLFCSKNAISSTKFEGSIPLGADFMYFVDFVGGGMFPYEIQFSSWKPFKTVNNPYYFGE